MTFSRRSIVVSLICIVVSIGACTPGSTESELITAQEIIAKDQASQWDLVVLGDSDMWLSYEYYVPLFEEDLGVSIVVHDQIRPGEFWPVDLLKEDDELRNLISNAEIIIFNVPFVNPAVGGACFDQNRSFDGADCFDVSLEEYSRWTLEMITDIKALAGSDGAMIRLQNMFVPLKHWESNLLLKDRLDTCLECFSSYWDAQAQVAEDEGIPLVDVFSLFHGPDGNQDPYEKGYFGSDPIHVNDVGAEAIADLYRSVGYEYWLPE